MHPITVHVHIQFLFNIARLFIKKYVRLVEHMTENIFKLMHISVDDGSCVMYVQNISENLQYKKCCFNVTVNWESSERISIS